MANAAMTHDSSMAVDRTRAEGTREPASWLATLVGATSGALAFALCALWLGATAGIAIALLSTLIVLARRHASAALAFVVAGTLSALALRPSTAFALAGAVAYGVGLALAVRRSRASELLA